MPNAYWDIETRSAVSLRECGAHIYATSSTTQPLCLAYAIDDDEPLLWLPTDPPPELFLDIGANPNDWRLVAHNWEFERLILEHILIPRYGFRPIPLEIQHCSQRLAMANAYLAELDVLALALDLPYRKDPAARRAMLQVSRPRAPRKRKPTTIPTWNTDPALLDLVYQRCRADVVATRAVFTSPKLEPLSETERRYQLQDAVINARGVRLDRGFVAAAMELAFRERTAINLKLQELTHGAITSVGQNVRFLAAVNACGHATTTVNKRAVAQILAHKPDDYVRQLLELRQIGARAAVNKFKRMLAYAAPHDDRLRGTLRMFGTATGRWVGLGPQLQNLKERKRPAALGGRFGSPRRPRRYRSVWRPARAARRHLPRRARERPRLGAQKRRFQRGRKRGSGVARRRAVEARRLSDLLANRRHDARAVPGDRAEDA
jgi:DNA polymerase